ncbi:glycosyltransferase [Caldiplasma sukawensis]
MVIPKASVILPTYNEAQNLPVLIHRLMSLNIDLEIVVIDDNSPDGTGDVAERLVKKYGSIKVIHRSGKLGIATAVKEGIKNSSSKYIIVMDSDLQHPPETVPQLIRKLDEGYEIAIASRYVRGGEVEFSLPRKLISRVATLIAHINIQETEGIRDPMSGFFAFKKDIIDPDQIKSSGYKILLEILVIAGKRRIVEVPINFSRRAYGKSKLGMKEFIKYIMLIFKLSNYQMIKFLFVGIVGAAVNVALLDYTADYLHLYRYMAILIALEVSIITNFLMNNFWTYRKRRSKGTVIQRFAKYNMTSSLGSAINFALIILLTFFGIPLVLADVIGIIGAFGANFGGSQGLVWHL